MFGLRLDRTTRNDLGFGLDYELIPKQTKTKKKKARKSRTRRTKMIARKNVEDRRNGGENRSKWGGRSKNFQARRMSFSEIEVEAS